MLHRSFVPALIVGIGAVLGPCVVGCGGAAASSSVTARAQRASAPEGNAIYRALLVPGAGAIVLLGEPREAERAPSGSVMHEGQSVGVGLLEGDPLTSTGSNEAAPRFALARWGGATCVGPATRAVTMYYEAFEGASFTAAGVLVPSCGADAESIVGALAVHGDDVERVHFDDASLPELEMPYPASYDVRMASGTVVTVAHPEGQEGVCYLGPALISAGSMWSIEVPYAAAIVTGLLQVGDRTHVVWDACAWTGVTSTEGEDALSGENPFATYCEC